MGTTAKTTAGAGVRVRVILAACALALLVAVGAAATAGAERPTGLDSHAVGCRGIYDQAKRLRDEYKQLSLTDPGSPRLDAIINEGQNLGRDWLAAKCNERFGSIALLVRPVVSPFAPVLDEVHDIVADPGVVVRPVARPFAPVADPGQVIVADPGQDGPVPAEDAETIVPVPVEDDEVITIDDPVPVEDEQP